MLGVNVSTRTSTNKTYSTKSPAFSSFQIRLMYLIRLAMQAPLSDGRGQQTSHFSSSPIYTQSGTIASKIVQRPVPFNLTSSAPIPSKASSSARRKLTSLSNGAFLRRWDFSVANLSPVHSAKPI